METPIRLYTESPVSRDLVSVRVGTAGWSVPRQHAAHFPDRGSNLERYGAVLNAVEINSSFHRPHRYAVYERWASSVPQDFRFAVKLPKTINHQCRLKETGELVDSFLSDVRGLGAKLGPLLVQLPPSLAFEEGVGDTFLRELRGRVEGGIVCEPRHASWFTPEVDGLLDELRVARVAADPARVPGADEPGGWRELTYYRLHGSPRIYYSPYSHEAIQAVVAQLASRAAGGSECWCIFDNTAAFAATANALTAKLVTRTAGQGSSDSTRP